MNRQPQRSGPQAVMAEYEILTKAWSIIKNHRDILTTGTELEWQIVTQEAQNLFQMGNTSEQKILAQRVAGALMDYFGEIGKKWEPSDTQRG